MRCQLQRRLPLYHSRKTTKLHLQGSSFAKPEKNNNNKKKTLHKDPDPNYLTRLQEGRLRSLSLSLSFAALSVAK